MAAQEEAKAATRHRRRGHPLLRACKRERYTHGLHPAQMEALRAMCGALIPSLPAAERLRSDIDSNGGGSKDLERFYLVSAADGAIPEEVAELVTRCVWEAVVLVNVVLWILSTKIGTLALCGQLCISGKFTYVRRFADMPVERREEALTQWNKTRWLFPLKITFVVIKILSHYAFYTTDGGSTLLLTSDIAVPTANLSSHVGNGRPGAAKRPACARGHVLRVARSHGLLLRVRPRRRLDPRRLRGATRRADGSPGCPRRDVATLTGCNVHG